MGYVVTAGYVSVETAVPGGRAWIDLPRGVVLPDDVPAETRDRLLASGEIAEVGATEPTAPVAPVDEPPPPGPADGTIEAILARVGVDPALAREALDAEQAKPRPRSTLVAALTEIISR